MFIKIEIPDNTTLIQANILTAADGVGTLHSKVFTEDEIAKMVIFDETCEDKTKEPNA